MAARVRGSTLSGLVAGADGAATLRLSLPNEGPPGELEDQFPVRQLVLVIGMLDDIGQLAGSQFLVPSRPALRRPRHPATVARRSFHIGFPDCDAEWPDGHRRASCAIALEEST